MMHAVKVAEGNKMPPLKRVNMLKHTFAVFLANEEWKAAARSMFMKLNEALGFQATPPWPDSYKEASEWVAKLSAQRKFSGSWIRYLRAPDDDTYMVGASFDHGSDMILIQNHCDERFYVSMPCTPGLFAGNPQAAEVVLDFQRLVLTATMTDV